MDQDVVRAIVETDYAVPAGQTVEGLTALLLSALGSPDPALREPAPEIIDIWIGRGLYTAARLREMAVRMVDNLAVGLGDYGADTMFLRAFSLLVLTSIVNQDIMHPFYDEPEVRVILDRVLAYVGAERDLRGYVPGAGWAHAAAHSGDMLWVFASHHHLNATDLERVLDAVAALVAPPMAHVYLYNEDERLAHAALGVLCRDLVPPPAVDAWLDRLVRPDGRDLGFDALLSQPAASIRHNVIAFLRALYFQVAGLTYAPEALPPGLPDYIAAQIRQAPSVAGFLLPSITHALRAINVF